MILLDLPSDLLVEILRRLPLLDTVAPCSTCHHLRNLASGALTNHPLAEVYETDWKQKRLSLTVMRRIIALKIRGNKGSYPMHWLTRLAPYSSHLRILDVRESASFIAAMVTTPEMPVPAAVFPTVTTLYATEPLLRGAFFMGVDITFPGLVVLHMGHTPRLPPAAEEPPAPVEPRFGQLRWVFWSCRPDPLPVRFPAGCHFVKEMIEVGLVGGTPGLEQVLAAGHLASRVYNPLWAAVDQGRWDLFDFLTASTAPGTLLARPGYLREAAPPRLLFPLYTIDTCFAKPYPGSTLAVCCALTDRVDLMQRLVDRGADPFAADLSRYDGPSPVREVARRVARKVAPPKLVAWYEALMQAPALAATSRPRERGKELAHILWDVSPEDDQPSMRKIRELLEEGRLAAHCPALAQGMLEEAARYDWDPDPNLYAIAFDARRAAALADLLLRFTVPSPQCFVTAALSGKSGNYEKLRAAYVATHGPTAMRDLYADRTLCYEVLRAFLEGERPRTVSLKLDRLVADGVDLMVAPPQGRPRLLAIVDASSDFTEQLISAGHVPEQGDVDARYGLSSAAAQLLQKADKLGVRLRIPQRPDWPFYMRNAPAERLRCFLTHGMEATPSFLLTLIRCRQTDAELPALLRFALKQVAPEAWQPLFAPTGPATGRGSFSQLAPALRLLRETLVAWRANPGPDPLRTLSEALDLLPEREPLVARCVHSLPNNRCPCRPGINLAHVLLVLVVRKWQTPRGTTHPARVRGLALRRQREGMVEAFLDALCRSSAV
ncbi:hypothetical protein PAPYR_10188 [Paratrimastix pyriformis]|uniref:F-box domain-containing protein n=1 Tax=Paratrimastix pyriformis TaxID=342808 RepID=A0ABQ8UDN8_9EUKA|nr:hypothetical protein PAPYR_10188 [Paratrimastix pyriformis]